MTDRTVQGFAGTWSRNRRLMILMIPPFHGRVRRIPASLAFLLAVASWAGAEGRLTDALTTEAQMAAGIPRLGTVQLDALNDQIGRELALARAGDVRGFAGTFSGRRTPAERTAAGLASLSAGEIARIDTWVAGLLASPARPDWPVFTPVARRSAIEPVPERPRLHGQVTAMYGWGSGGSSTFGGSLSTTYFDPARKFSATVTLSDYRTDPGNLPRYLSRERQ